MARHLPRIEGYRIIGVLGQGGMGIVYRAVQAKLDRMVALKVLPAIVSTANPLAASRFRREATAAARLHHTNIVPIYDYGESQDTCYYAMELITGQPLNTLIHRFAEQGIASASPARLVEILRASLLEPPSADAEQPCDDGSSDDSFLAVASSSTGRGRPYYLQVATWMADAAEALHYAHGQGITHRDIKPANLILSADGHMMITDFGLARDAAAESITMTGALLGTLRYISPEQAMAKRVRVDHRTDIYSLGATMYELLCFAPAFPGIDEKEILGAIIAHDPIAPRKVAHTVPAELETICLKMMEKSPAARYATARALAEDLRRFLHDLPIVATRPGPIKRMVKFARRRKAVVVAAATLVLLSTTAVFWAREKADRRVETARRVQAEKRQRTAQIQALNDSGLYLAGERKWERAEATLREALALDPNHIDTILTLVWMKIEHFKQQPDLADTESLEAIEELCKRVLDIDPDHSDALNYHSILLKKMGRYSEAIAVARKLAEQQPDNFFAWSNLGQYEALTGDLTAAEEHLKMGVELAGTEKDQWRAAAWRNLAALQLHLRDSASVDTLDTAISLGQGDIASWVLRVRLRLTLAEHTDVEEALHDAHYADRQANGAHPKAKRMRALAHLRNGEFDHAIQHADLAIKLGDMPAINYLIQAVAHAKQNKPIVARNDLVAAVAQWPASFTDGEFAVSLDEGVLWFESAAELVQLLDEARALLDSDTP